MLSVYTAKTAVSQATGTLRRALGVTTYLAFLARLAAYTAVIIVSKRINARTSALLQAGMAVYLTVASRTRQKRPARIAAGSAVIGI